MEKNIHLLEKEIAFLIIDNNNLIIFCSQCMTDMVRNKTVGKRIDEILDSNSFITYNTEILNWKNISRKINKINLLDVDGELIPVNCIIRKTDNLENARFSIQVFPLSLSGELPIDEDEKQIREYSENIFHDLKSYLFNINSEKVDLNKLLSDAEPELKNHLDVLSANIEGLNFLVDNLSCYAQLGRKEFKYKKCNLYDILIESFYSIKRTMEEFNITEIEFIVYENNKIIFSCRTPMEILLLNANKKLDHEMYCDPDFIKRVIINLLDNAVKYSRLSSPPKIEILIEKGEQMDTISIRDNGIGIRKVDQREIFHKDFRANVQLVKSSRGSGLGLAISKEIVEKHRGEIHFNSKVNKYTQSCIPGQLRTR